MAGNHAAQLGRNFRMLRGNIRTLTASGLAHLAQDGFADMLYVFFPVWQAGFGLTFAQVGLFKMLFSGTLAFLQVPSSLLVRRLGAVGMLLGGSLLTSLAAIAYGWAASPFVLGCLLVAGGIGASVQHPISSTLVSNACSDKEQRRTALSIFNVTGDVGKLVFPAAAALLISRYDWPTASRAMGLFGVAVTFAVCAIIAPVYTPSCSPKPAEGLVRPGASVQRGNRAFSALLAIGILDSATRMGYLTYFPFLMRDKGADIALTGFALSLIFGGGIAGKFFCGILATRVGVLRTVVITEALTGLCIWATIALPRGPTLALCPLLGLALNGTSSVLYGSVPELVPEERRTRSFAVFYTATIGSGGVAPLLYGMAGDSIGIIPMLAVAGILIFATLPLMLPLRGKLAG